LDSLWQELSVLCQDIILSHQHHYDDVHEHHHHQDHVHHHHHHYHHHHHHHHTSLWQELSVLCQLAHHPNVIQCVGAMMEGDAVTAVAMAQAGPSLKELVEVRRLLI
jgi:hypothetical protein